MAGFQKTEATKTEPKAEDDKPKKTTVKDGEKAKAKADTKPRRSTRKPGPKTLEAKLVESCQGVGTLLLMAGQVHDGVIIYSRAESLSHAWAQAADSNKQVERILRMLTEGGVWGGVIITTTSVALPIMQNHGLLGQVPNPFALAQSDVDQLPEELQMMVAMHQEAMQKNETPAPAGANGSPS